MAQPAGAAPLAGAAPPVAASLPADAAPPPAPLLDSLPRTVLSDVLAAVIARSTPGSVVALALTCRAMLAACAAADGLWQRQAAALGWADIAAAPNTFARYSARMRVRTSVRRQLARVSTYLDRRAAAALNRGAPPAVLAAAEARLGVSLPWELWELLRHRDGQALEPGAVLIDDARLLSAHELFIEERELPPPSLAPAAAPAAAQEPAAALGALQLGQARGGGWERTARAAGGGGSGRGGGEAAAAAGGTRGAAAAARDAQVHAPPGSGGVRRARLIIFASNAGGSRMYGLALGGDCDGVGGSGSGGGDGGAREGGGSVYVLRGLLTTRRVASNLLSFLQRLLA